MHTFRRRMIVVFSTLINLNIHRVAYRIRNFYRPCPPERNGSKIPQYLILSRLSLFHGLRARRWLETTAFLTGNSVARYVHSLAPLTLQRSALPCSLCLLSLFMDSLTHSLGSLSCRTVKTPCVHAVNAFEGNKRVFGRHKKHVFLSLFSRGRATL